jgi:hypothetical protein
VEGNALNRKRWLGHQPCNEEHTMVGKNEFASGVSMRATEILKDYFKAIAAIFVIILLFAGAAMGQMGDGVGTTSGEILNMGIGSRAASLGGAYTAFSNDATAPFWNPSGMSALSQIEFQFGHSSWYQDISLDYLGLVLPLSERMSTGIGVAYVDYGEFTAYSVDDMPMGQFSGHNVVLSLSLAYRLSGSLSVGVTAKGISEKLEESSAFGYAFDIGTRFNAGIFSFGLAAKNIGSGLKYEYERAPLPTKLTTGVGITTFDGRFRVAGDLNIPRDGIVSMHQGVEYLYLNTIFLRTGYTHCFADNDYSEKEGLVYGFGLKILKGTIDYAYMPNGDFGAIHKIDLSIKLDR